MKRVLFLIAILACAASAEAAGGLPAKTDKFSKDVPLDIAGSFWIENPTGAIDIIGTDQPTLSISAVKSVTGEDEAALKEGFEQTQIVMQGDSHVRVLKTVSPAIRAGKWKCVINFIVRLPRTAHVKISTTTAEHIRITGISGNVTIKNYNGAIILDRVAGSTIVDTVNGSIRADFANAPSVNMQLSSVNGEIEVHVPEASNFEWVADTIQGDFLTNLPVRGRFNGSTFRAALNSPGGPTLTTASLTQKIYLLRNGSRRVDARSVLQQRAKDSVPIPVAPAQFEVKFQAATYPGSLLMSVPLGSVEVGIVNGNARVETGAGAVKLDKVVGEAAVFTLGGPLTIGEVYRNLIAHTDAGDILVSAAREGGEISTGGGSIRLLYTSGPTTLRSGGGDIIVRQAFGPIDAQTKSGDITITVDTASKGLKIDAKSTQGNIVLNLHSRFGADIEAVVTTSDEDSNPIHTDFPGLTIKREQIAGGKTRIRATGKINGGGEKITLTADDGDIHITSQASSSISVIQ